MISIIKKRPTAYEKVNTTERIARKRETPKSDHVYLLKLFTPSAVTFSLVGNLTKFIPQKLKLMTPD